ncbi:unknown protein [Seminavis robusta]|uniref:Uncharacterized protein n=1 Tax=Seminavis robusta TaxID=568900 RepID=A0A9N8EYG9_9STRA|nr:unknown protein [Seminavis robusta]|eukprot:Sro2492_g329200.1 n/a (262) ;mRNA; f:12868-13653
MGTSRSKRRKKQQKQRQQQQQQQQQQHHQQELPQAHQLEPHKHLEPHQPPPTATPPGSTEPPQSTPVKSPVDPPSVHRLPVVPPPSYQLSGSSFASSNLGKHDTTMISQQQAQLVEALHQQKEETMERQAAFEARLSQKQQDINQSSVSIHWLVHTLMDQTNKQLCLMGIGGIIPIPSNASSSLYHHPYGLLPMRQGVEGTTVSIAHSQGSSESIVLGSGLMSVVEDHPGPSPQPQVDIDVAIPPCGDEVIDHFEGPQGGG